MDMSGTGGRRAERGQASIMIALMMVTFITFFAFVVNTGMLVNAKINLQNAADVAAYAGAAVQARQLNQIGFLNYEMRRQYKKFLYRYYVIGGMAQKSFQSGPRTGIRLWSPDGNRANNFQVPAVCLIYLSDDNFCQVWKLDAIKPPNRNPFDSINEVLRQQIKKLEDLREKNCLQIGSMNVRVLTFWLWNTDPYFKVLEAKTPPGDTALPVLRSVASGLGLIPRELILRKRIQTIHEYVNFPAQPSVTVERVQDLKKEGDVAARERTIQAFQSAYNTLGNHTFAPDGIVMTELLPAEKLKLNDVKVGFDTYAIDFVLTPRGNPQDGNDCDASPIIMTVPPQVPVAVTKDPSVLTYYAVRLEAKAKLLFSPVGELTLRAYSAAQPFGSRIAPPGLSESDYLRNAFNQNTCGVTNPSCARKVPNLPIKAKESGGGISPGWRQNDVLHAMY